MASVQECHQILLEIKFWQKYYRNSKASHHITYAPFCLGGWLSLSRYQWSMTAPYGVSPNFATPSAIWVITWQQMSRSESLYYTTARYGMLLKWVLIYTRQWDLLLQAQRHFSARRQVRWLQAAILMCFMSVRIQKNTLYKEINVVC